MRWGPVSSSGGVGVRAGVSLPPVKSRGPFRDAEPQIVRHSTKSNRTSLPRKSVRLAGAIHVSASSG
jgi:hypothetical protein